MGSLIEMACISKIFLLRDWLHELPFNTYFVAVTLDIWNISIEPTQSYFLFLNYLNLLATIYNKP